MAGRLKTVTVFGSGKVTAGDRVYQQAWELGRALARSDLMVCNGGYGGIMEASARGAKEAGGKTIGVTTKAFGCGANRWIDREICEETHAARLLKLIELGNAYVVMPGGTGTLVELATVWEYRNKGLMTQKPIHVLGDFWNPVIEHLNEILMQEGSLSAAQTVHRVGSIDECVRRIGERLRGES